ncbi:STAS domain-containing protein [Kutzneria sp. NPDC052558]|uniref:STAS domain-containing protein n=1 Tax=Kutzneria sp. NPDC052558 TaxID=3364121 RepID=UPI0037C69AB9
MIETKAQAEVLTLALAGELDVGTQAATSARIHEALAGAPKVLVLDLREVDFLGSTGLSVLIEAQRAAELRNTVICLVADRRATLLPLELTGLTTMFPVFRTPQEALRSADAQRQQAGVVPRVGADMSQ